MSNSEGQDNFEEREEIFQDDDDYFDDAEDRGQTLANLLQPDNMGQANEFVRNDDDQIKDIVEVVRKRKTKAERQDERRKRQIRVNLRVYENSMKCYFMRGVLSQIRKLANLNQEYAKSQVLSRIELSDMVKLLDLKTKTHPFSTRSRFLLTLLTKYSINDVNSIETLFKFVGLITRRIYLIDLKPFDLKKIELDYFRGRKQKKNTKDPTKPISQVSQVLNKIQEEVAGEEQLDEVENYARVKQKNKNIRLPTQEELENSQMSSNCLDMLANKISLSRTLNSESTKALQSRTALKADGEKYEWIDVFDPDINQWRLIDCKGHVIYDVEILKRQLNGVPTVLIFSVGLLDIKPENQWLFAHRNIRKVEVKDQTNRFCDNIFNIHSRRRRIAVRDFLKQLMYNLKYRGPQDLQTDQERQCQAADEKLFYDIACKNFPKTMKEMRDSDTFIVSSLMDKFHMFRQTAVPTEFMFKQQQVFLRKDLEHLHSKYAWVDVGRMVKDDEQSVKTTLTRDQNKQLKLYKYSQTIPCQIVVRDGKFDKNEFGSIYINRKTKFPPGTVLIKQNVRYVCKKNGLQQTEVIQGFSKRVPNQIGFLIFKKDKARILQLYKERVEYLKEKKKASEQNQLKGLWKKLFKSILIADSLQQRYAQQQ